MPVNTAQVLAALADDAYGADPGAHEPIGFTAFDFAGLHMHDGLYTHGHGAAAVSTGMLDGQQVMVVAFRGTDGAHDWISDVTNIDDQYGAFKSLVKAVEQFADAGGKVVLTGHSAGGAMAQIFMSEHLGDDHYRAVTFGSPGALPEKHVFGVHADPRITNYVVSDDPIVVLGEHRGDLIGDAVKTVGGLLGGVLQEFASLTHISLGGLFSSAKAIAGDYVNNGITVTLPGAGPALSVHTALTTGLSEHDPATYVALTGASTVFEPHLW
ncbi:Mbeg1-like protein [Phenylobacterium sp.]|uniref:lipase family protein n=1 Tax=Phenylobacterium sp. TaxID=1871053 RepID=UPI0025F50C7D|nr:Mbeg1-like protein [Phenylobacterium sp.]